MIQVIVLYEIHKPLFPSPVLPLNTVAVNDQRLNTFKADGVMRESPLIGGLRWARMWMGEFGFSGDTAHGVHTRTHRLKSVLSWQDDEVVLQCVACIQKENRKFCLAAEGLGNRLCYLEPTSEAKVGTVTPLLQGLILHDLKTIKGNTGMHVLVWLCLLRVIYVCFLCSDQLHVHMQKLIFSANVT